eukprot:m51a1_g1559 hypothetical protein (371) ;mRNA; r:32095-33486
MLVAQKLRADVVDVGKVSSDFMSAFDALVRDDDLANEPADISTDEIQVPTYGARCERLIAEALATKEVAQSGRERPLVPGADIDEPALREAVAHAPRLRSVQLVRCPPKDVAKRLQSSVNYLAPIDKGTKGKKDGESEEDQLLSVVHGGSESKVQRGEVVLSFAVCRPGRSTKSQEYEVLGSQFLTALRDRINCTRDHTKILRDTGDDVMAPSFFFFGNTFYNDTRKTKVVLSTPIAEWALAKGIGCFETRDMQSTRFTDLKLKVGTAPYVFLHCGDCEHRIMCTEVRMWAASSDPADVQSYPRATYLGLTSRKKCRICNLFAARHVTYYDKHAPESPCLWCSECYNKFHFCNGRLLYEDFQVFDYVHES